jgi:hypothetical protein
MAHIPARHPYGAAWGRSLAPASLESNPCHLSDDSSPILIGSIEPVPIHRHPAFTPVIPAKQGWCPRKRVRGSLEHCAVVGRSPIKPGMTKWCWEILGQAGDDEVALINPAEISCTK